MTTVNSIKSAPAPAIAGIIDPLKTVSVSSSIKILHQDLHGNNFP